MSANVPAFGEVRPLDRPPSPEAPVTPEEVTAADRLVRILARLTQSVRDLSNRWWAHRIDFEDRAVLDDGTTKLRLEHRLAGRVRYWPVEWVGDNPPNLRRHASSDANTLVLTSTSAGVVTIRVEEAG